MKVNDVLLRNEDGWLHFANPYQILTAERLEDVLPMLRGIEGLVQRNGWYAAGCLSYEAASAFDGALQTQPGAGFPYLWFGLYPPPRLIQLPDPTQIKPILDLQPTPDIETYNAAIARIRKYIADGCTYQVNFTMRLQAAFAEDPWNLFLHLAQTQNKHAAYIDTGQHVICSASPELFFELEGERITCRPMKGTTRRGRTTQEDREQCEWLERSEKNRAENVMIVDMIRNDLGRIAKTGSVCVPELFTTERYPTLWQMTSTVTAQTNCSLTEIFTALFPCASITGAPKVSTMKVIAELEGTPRKIYTGTIGYISPHRKANFSVAIRTLLIDRTQRKAEYGVGGGIVWDSTEAEEYSEALLKARLLTERLPVFSLLETMLWTPAKGFFLQEKHVARLTDSASYFGIPLTSKQAEEYLAQIAAHFCTPQRVRVTLDRAGNFSFESKTLELETGDEPLRVCLAKGPIDVSNIFLFHKTTQRAVYEAARVRCLAYDDVLLYNPDGEITEFTIGNVVVELDGKYLTPPISSGVLAGTFRAHLLETGQVQERAILIERLKNCTKVLRVNSIRKWQAVEIQSKPIEL